MNSQDNSNQYPSGYHYQNPFPPNPVQEHNRKTLWIILGILGGIALICIISVAGYFNIKHQVRVDRMESVANRIIPESDWVEERNFGVSGGPYCVSFDQICFSLSRHWVADSPVDVEVMADQLGIPMKLSTTDGCMRGYEGRGSVEVCAYESERVDPGKWFISFRVSER